MHYIFIFRTSTVKWKSWIRRCPQRQTPISSPLLYSHYKLQLHLSYNLNYSKTLSKIDQNGPFKIINYKKVPFLNKTHTPKWKKKALKHIDFTTINNHTSTWPNNYQKLRKLVDKNTKFKNVSQENKFSIKFRRKNNAYPMIADWRWLLRFTEVEEEESAA